GYLGQGAIRPDTAATAALQIHKITFRLIRSKIVCCGGSRDWRLSWGLAVQVTRQPQDCLHAGGVVHPTLPEPYVDSSRGGLEAKLEYVDRLPKPLDRHRYLFARFLIACSSPGPCSRLLGAKRRCTGIDHFR